MAKRQCRRCEETLRPGGYKPEETLCGACVHDLRDAIMHECQGCNLTWCDDELAEIEDYGQRVGPGDLAPSGECPGCGALCFPVAGVGPRPHAFPGPWQCVEVSGATLALVLPQLIAESAAWVAEPWPDDTWLVGVKADRLPILRRMIEEAPHA